jgi:hypothetical protein
VVSKMAFLRALMGGVASTARLTVAIASAQGYMHIFFQLDRWSTYWFAHVEPSQC